MNRDALTPLTVLVPPQLERAIGYEREARYVALYWGAGDEAYYDDGRFSGTGEWNGYLTFVRHPAIEPALRPYHLGDSETEARHWLILDREARTLYVAPLRQANRFLQEQWPREEASSEPVTMTSEEMMQAVLDALNMQNWQEVPATVDTGEIMRRMQAQAQLVQEMKTWLDQHR
jgi:hypothetical protein